MGVDIKLPRLLTTTTYDVWFRDLPLSEFRRFSEHVEHWQAEEMAEFVRHSPAASKNREVRVARRTLNVEWLDD
jgi:hypothetical protein